MMESPAAKNIVVGEAAWGFAFPDSHVILDEIGPMPDGEMVPLMRERSATWANRITSERSTPTVKGDS
jgi:hypothetical protein